MSRIILAFYPDTDEQHLVVGWDRPLSTYYWQEFNKEPEGEGDSKWDGNEDWEEMLQYAGYSPNELPTLLSFSDSLPSKFKPYVDKEVLNLLREHAVNPNTGSIIKDLSKRSWKCEVKTSGDSDWSTNGVRFATEHEAREYADDLVNRWLAVREWRVVRDGMSVNYKWQDGKAVAVAS